MSGSAGTSSILAGRARGRSCNVCGVGGCIVTAGVEGGGGGMNGGKHGGGGRGMLAGMSTNGPTGADRLLCLQLLGRLAQQSAH